MTRKDVNGRWVPLNQRQSLSALHNQKLHFYDLRYRQFHALTSDRENFHRQNDQHIGI